MTASKVLTVEGRRFAVGIAITRVPAEPESAETSARWRATGRAGSTEITVWGKTKRLALGDLLKQVRAHLARLAVAS